MADHNRRHFLKTTAAAVATAPAARSRLGANNRIRAAVVDKVRLPEEARRWGEQKMYEYAVGELVKHSSVDELS